MERRKTLLHALLEVQKLGWSKQIKTQAIQIHYLAHVRRSRRRSITLQKISIKISLILNHHDVL